MTKKRLFFGTAAIAVLSLLVLFTFVGCSNPSSGSTEYSTQASGDYPYPPETVSVDDRDQLNGLLNDYSADTNHVTHIRYTGAITGSQLEIPSGKYVYWDTGAPVTINVNIVVKEDANLVLVDAATIGGGQLLVRGTVTVFKGLKMRIGGDGALNVADYTVENDHITGRNTVIGTNKVQILPGAVLTLDVDDLIPPYESLPNKFTPVQAWAAAGQGHLVIGAAGTPRNPDPTPSATYDYTVKDLYQGITPSPGRTYTASSRGADPAKDILPSVIPAGIYIRTGSNLVQSDDTTLTVNGGLWTEGTLEDITEITLGNGGTLGLTETISNVLTGLKTLTIGAGASFGVVSPVTTLGKLDTLTIRDGGSINIPGGNVSFTTEPDTTLGLTLGKKTFYNVGLAPNTVVDVDLSEDASLITGSTLTVNPGSTFILAQDKTLTVEGGATLNLVKAIADDTGITTPPVQINGAIVVKDDGVIALPDPTGFTTPGDISTVIAYGQDGKIVLEKGGQAYLAAAKYVDDVTGGTYQMAANSEVEISTHYMKISGGNVNLVAGTTIPKTDTLEIDADGSLTIGNAIDLTLNAEGTAGATIIGAGAVKASSTSISGGTYGWQAKSSGAGVATIVIGATTAGGVSDITADAVTVSLTALGPGAIITQAGGATNNLTIAGPNPISTDGVINLSTGGSIILLADGTVAAKITLDQYCLIKIGSGLATADVTNANLVIALDNSRDSIAVASDLEGKASALGAGVLTQIIGAAATDNTITGPDDNENLVITANMPATGT